MRAISLVIVACVVVSLSTAAQADCQSEEARILQLMSDQAQRMTGGSICHTARDAERVFREVASFYERCPINDPGGQMRQSTREMINWARETQSSACAR